MQDDEEKWYKLKQFLASRYTAHIQRVLSNFSLLHETRATDESV